MASSRINFAEVYSFFNDESRLGNVLQTLEQNSNESSRKYWLSVKDYLPSIPDWVHKLLILVNLDGAHWVLVRVDFRKNKVWIYDSLLTFRDDKRYKLKFKPLEVIFPQWLEYVGFYNIRPELQSTDPWKLRARHNKSPELAIAFNASHVEYFKKKIAVDIFNDDIVL
ncbi:hypothetical protein CUMW_226240 [Citrus unshiu]|uniref:Ubiquitin-like protease family profile domain-containing protein n=1 Tax=Citrus unshiu TaxID=55188 RepID=A0A2H5QFX0_CITUN|nr:hypothetical protein CUMW_226240 [Citrus unshiu]